MGASIHGWRKVLQPRCFSGNTQDETKKKRNSFELGLWILGLYHLALFLLQMTDDRSPSSSGFKLEGKKAVVAWRSGAELQPLLDSGSDTMNQDSVSHLSALPPQGCSLSIPGPRWMTARWPQFQSSKWKPEQTAAGSNGVLGPFQPHPGSSSQWSWTEVILRSSGPVQTKVVRKKWAPIRKLGGFCHQKEG